jgi:hypothetical protein
VYQKLVTRLEAAGPAGIGFVRLLPGARPWATLVSGAIGVPPRRFLLGTVPALIAWQGGWTLLGVLVGVPAEHFLGRFERLALRGFILIVLGAITFLITKRLRAEGVFALHERRLRPLDLLLTGGAGACVVAGVLGLARGVVHLRGVVWLDLLLAGVALGVVAGRTALRDAAPPEPLLPGHGC